MLLGLTPEMPDPFIGLLGMAPEDKDGEDRSDKFATEADGIKAVGAFEVGDGAVEEVGDGAVEEAFRLDDEL